MEKNYENWCTFAEVVVKTKVVCFIEIGATHVNAMTFINAVVTV